MLHFGFVTKYLSDAIVTGILVFKCKKFLNLLSWLCSSQRLYNGCCIPHRSYSDKLLAWLFRIENKDHVQIHWGISYVDPFLSHDPDNNYFSIEKNCIELFKSIEKTNLAACIISIVSIIFLYVIKEQVNHRFSKKMFMPVPIELLVVSLSPGSVLLHTKIKGILPIGRFWYFVFILVQIQSKIWCQHCGRSTTWVCWCFLFSFVSLQKIRNLKISKSHFFDFIGSGLSSWFL